MSGAGLETVQDGGALPAAMLRDVRAGLLERAQRSLPAYLFYDAVGSALYEQITELPEYYPTRTERAILARYADDIVARVTSPDHPLHVVELGAGTATKTRLVLSAVVARQGGGHYVPIDVSPSALEVARLQLEAELPSLVVEPFVGHHEAAFARVAALGPRRLVLFIGSSIGNFDDAEALTLLQGVRASLAPGGALLLGTDLVKDEARLVRAYDDAAGVTAAFNLNVLARLNRELGADFALDRFRHRAVWNAAEARIEMHLESVEDQEVSIGALGARFRLRGGETIHTESSVKYTQARVDALLRAAGFAPEVTYHDDARLYAVHLARAV